MTGRDSGGGGGDDDLTAYVWEHYKRFLTPVEGRAAWAVFARDKANVGSTVVAEFIWKRHNLAVDPEVMAAIADGIDVFKRRVAQRILHEHASHVIVNRCPNCHRLARTPKAQQCFRCGHDWHPR